MSERDYDDTTVELGKLAHKVLQGKNRNAMQKLIADEHPDVVFPEVQSMKLVEDATKPLHEKIKTLEDEREKRESRDRLESRRKVLREKGVSEKKVADYEFAHHLMTEADRAAEAATSPRSFGPPQLPKGDGKDAKENMLYKNPTQYAREQAHKAVSEIIASRGR